MLRKLQSLLLLLTCAVSVARAQGEKKTALVKGHVVNQATQAPASEAPVSIPYLKMLTTTDGDGNFVMSQVPYGTHDLVVGGNSSKPDTVRISVTGDVVELGTLSLVPNDAATSQQSINIPTIALEESDVSGDEDGGKTQNVSGLLTASRDPFLNAAAFIFGPYRFQPRGYDRNSQNVLINGAPMNDVETGDAYWSQWGGLNDVFRSRSNTYGLQPSEYAFGGPNGTVAFDATAANQRKQTRITFSAANRNYRNRLMVTQSSGLMSSGWAYSVSLSKRWANEGYIDGTFYDGYSYYAAVSKRIKENHTVSLTAFGAPTRRGKSAPATQEAYDLGGSNFYNPNWGYLNGEKRNAKVANSHQPVFLLNYEYALSSKTRWNTTFGYQFGKNANSTLDWYNAADPRPDYYKNLPSYYIYGTNPPDPAMAEAVRNNLISNPNLFQVDWDNLYQQNLANKEEIPNADGSGSGVFGRRSLYVIGNDVDEVKKFVFNTNLERVISEHTTLYAGVSAIRQRTESYRELEDLMGGDYYLNLNQFSERDNEGSIAAAQYDLDHPNRIIKEGDKYNYDYINHFTKAWLWAQGTFTFNKVDLFLAGNFGVNSFDREGLYRNGVFPEKSFGKSKMQNFTIYGLKGGVTYKLSGRHYLFLNGGIMQDAPTVENTFVSPRTRNTTVDNPTEQKTYTAEGGYLMKAPKLNIRVVGYLTDIKDAVEKKRYYREGTANTFVNYMMEGVDMRFIGTELAADVKISPEFSVSAVAAIGQAFYTNNPRAAAYGDNFLDTNGLGGLLLKEQPYMKNYYVASGPQSAYTAGINYRSKHYWYASVNFNFFDRNYVDVAPNRRTAESVDGKVEGSPEWHKLVDQEKLPSVFTIDLFGGKSFLLSKFSRKIPRNTFLYINAGISNLLDKKDIITGGFEQLRASEVGRLDLFPTKYFYGYGRNFFVNVSLKF